MFTILTRAGSARALKSVAVAAASSSERRGAASGWQQAVTSSAELISTTIVTIDVDMSIGLGAVVVDGDPDEPAGDGEALRPVVRADSDRRDLARHRVDPGHGAVEGVGDPRGALSRREGERPAADAE